MIIYTNLKVRTFTTLSKDFNILMQLLNIATVHQIELKEGVNEMPVSDKQPEKVLFWFAKSNAKSLVYYRVCESLESIYEGLKKLENHKELIK